MTYWLWLVYLNGRVFSCEVIKSTRGYPSRPQGVVGQRLNDSVLSGHGYIRVPSPIERVPAGQ